MIPSYRRKPPLVIPAKAGNQEEEIQRSLDPGLRRGDESSYFSSHALTWARSSSVSVPAAGFSFNTLIAYA